MDVAIRDLSIFSFVLVDASILPSYLLSVCNNNTLMKWKVRKAAEYDLSALATTMKRFLIPEQSRRLKLIRSTLTSGCQ